LTSIKLFIANIRYLQNYQLRYNLKGCC